MKKLDIFGGPQGASDIILGCMRMPALSEAEAADLIRAAVLSLNGKVQAAIDTIADVMNNEQNNPATRLQAAQTILSSAGKFAQRLQADESSVIMQIDSNRFGVW